MGNELFLAQNPSDFIIVNQNLEFNNLAYKL